MSMERDKLISCIAEVLAEKHSVLYGRSLEISNPEARGRAAVELYETLFLPVISKRQKELRSILEASMDKHSTNNKHGKLAPDGTETEAERKRIEAKRPYKTAKVELYPENLEP